MVAYIAESDDLVVRARRKREHQRQEGSALDVIDGSN